MQKKESTNDKIIRLFKSGTAIEAIATETGMIPENVRNVIESRIPDWENYDPEAEKKKEGGLFSINKKFYGKGKRVKINMTMGRDGFVADQTRVIAEMLAKGKTYEEISEMWNVKVTDIQRIDEAKEAHFKRYVLSHPEKAEEFGIALPTSAKAPAKKQTYVTNGEMPALKLPDSSTGFNSDDNSIEEIITPKAPKRIIPNIIVRDSAPTETDADKKDVPDISEDIDVVKDAVTIEGDDTQIIEEKTVSEDDAELETVEVEENDSLDAGATEETAEIDSEESDDEDMEIHSKTTAFKKLEMFMKSQIDQDQERVDELSTKIDVLDEDIAKKAAAMKALNEEYVELSRRRSEISVQYEALKKEYEASVAECKTFKDEREGILDEISQFSEMLVPENVG